MHQRGTTRRQPHARTGGAHDEPGSTEPWPAPLGPGSARPRLPLLRSAGVMILAIVFVAIVAASDSGRSGPRPRPSATDPAFGPTDDPSGVAASPRTAVRVSSI